MNSLSYTRFLNRNLARLLIWGFGGRMVRGGIGNGDVGSFVWEDLRLTRLVQKLLQCIYK